MIFALIAIALFAIFAGFILLGARKRETRVQRLIGNTSPAPRGTAYTGPRFTAHGREIARTGRPVL